jgi:indole-3-glycerol phosphate synthase
MPASRLDEIVKNKREEVALRIEQCPTNKLAKRAVPANGAFLKAINKLGRVNLITEIKPKSPSAGVLKEHLALDSVLSAYNKHAAAISVLTDEKYFGGSLKLLEEVAKKSPLPVLCKDFIIDAHQCYEARVYGAQAVLLIAKILPAKQLLELHRLITVLGMTPVVEVQTAEEMAAARAIEPVAVLINNRDLATFHVDLDTTARLASLVPPNAVLISASGIEGREDVNRLSKYCNTFLVGSSLMRADDIEAKLAELAAAQPVSRGEQK